MRSICGSCTLLAIAVVVLAISCARQGNPSGGPKDYLPPEVIKSDPENGATSFDGKSVTITFNEFVTLDKIQEKFMISPPTTNKPQVVLKGKSVVVTIDEKLRDSTTYTLYFQDAIRDLNEANILENYQFVFSTGPYIDSLSFTGSVSDAFSLEYSENLMVVLHSNLADTAPQKVIPDYISRTGKMGFFTLGNLSPGNYKLYALEDINNNRKYEPGDEFFAFLDTIISIVPEKHFVQREVTEHEHDSLGQEIPDSVRIEDLPPVIVPEKTLFVSKSKVERYYLASTGRRQAGLLEFNFSMPLDTFNFSFSAADIAPDSYLTEVSRNRDTFRIWLKDSLDYLNPRIEGILRYPSTDRDGNTGYIVDTVPLRFTAPTGRRVVAEKPPELVANVSTIGIHPGRNIRLTSAVPIATADLKAIIITEKKDSLKLPQPFTPLFDLSDPTKIEIKQNLPEGKDYILTLLPGVITTIFGKMNDTIVYPFRVRAVDTYGTLVTNLSGYQGNVIVQILDQTEKEVMRRTGESPGRVNFNFIDNGSYRLKVVYDTDGNGEWTTSDYAQKRFPEPVSYYNEIVEIKSNWDLILDWDISQQYQKSDTLRKKTVIRR